MMKNSKNVQYNVCPTSHRLDYVSFVVLITVEIINTTVEYGCDFIAGLQILLVTGTLWSALDLWSEVAEAIVGPADSRGSIIRKSVYGFLNNE